MSNELVKWDDIERQIDAATDIKVVVEMQEQMDAIKLLAKQQEDSLKTVNKCSVYKFRLEQKAGEIYAGLEAEKGGRPEKNSLPEVTSLSTKQSAEEETGRSRKTLNKWVRETDVPEEFIVEYAAKCNDEEKDVTSAAILRTWKEEQPREEPPSLPDNIYTVLYADPPWQYSAGHQHAEREQDTVLADHYGSMSQTELKDLDVKSVAAPNAVLFLWATSPALVEALEVIDAWGFKYKASFIWDKVKHNVGHYNSVRHELLLISTRGAFTPTMKPLKLIDSVQVIERSDKHSEKPEEFRCIIDRLYPGEKHIELFQRDPVPGWPGWGNEVNDRIL